MVVINERGPYVLQGVTTQSIPAGRAVTVVSGQSNLLSVSLAPANAAAGSVFVAVIPPDNFPKPARAGMYTNRGTSLVNVDSGTPGPDTEARYNFTPSLEEYTTIPSGWFVQLHRNCVVTVPAGAFNDNEKTSALPERRSPLLQAAFGRSLQRMLSEWLFITALSG